jgi:hypothetical protein
MFKKTKPPIANIDEHPQVVPLISRRLELQAQARALRGKRPPVWERFKKQVDTGHDSDPDPAALEARALALGQPMEVATSTRSQLIEIDNQLRALESAIELLRHKIETERARASAEICETIRPDFEKLEKAFAHKLVETINAARELYYFIDSHRDVGIATTVLNPDMPDFLHANDPHDVPAQWLRAAVKRGTLAAHLIPKSLTY